MPGGAWCTASGAIRLEHPRPTMDPLLFEKIDLRFDSHTHDWQPIDGWTARYRCWQCGVIAYKPRVVTILVDGGPYGSMKVTPYVCTATRAGSRCGCPPIAKRR